MTKYRLEEVCELITDGTHQTPEYCDDGGIVFLSSKDVTEQKINWNDVKHIPLKLHEKLSSRLVPRRNDILLAKNGTTGVAALVDSDEIFDIYVSLALLRPLGNILPRYLLYAVNSPVAKRQFNAGLKGIGVPNLHLSVIRKTEINVVPYEDQLMICGLLEKVSHVIELRKCQLKTIDELIKARFVELFGDMADPMCKWDKCKLVDACSDPNDIKCGPFGTQLGKDEYTTSGVEVWEIPQINSEFRTMPTHFVTREKAMDLGQYSIKPGDIAMSRKGNVGRCAVFPETFEEGIIHSDVLRIRVDNSRVAPVFMMRQLHYSGDIQHQIELVSSGAIMAGINVTKLKDIMVYIPPKELQDEFVSFVEQVDKSKAAVQKSLDETQLLFDSLMQKYFG